MTIVPNIYGPSNPPIASYDFFDIASGTGKETFYFGVAYASADKYQLSNIAFYSNQIGTSSGVTNNAAFTKVIDKDFDVEFARPTIINGLTIINIPHKMINTGGTTNYYGYVVADVKRVVNAVETSLISATGEEHQYHPTNFPENYHMNCLQVDIPQTHFKVGDLLRVTIEGYSKSDASTDMKLIIAHDPNGRTAPTFSDDSSADFSGDVTVATFQVPFRIEI